MSPNLPNRKSHRRRGFNYAGPGSYFLTFFTVDRIHHFGEVVDDQMALSDFGRMCEREWAVSLQIRREIIPHAYVTMPNHVHGLVSIADTEFPSDFDHGMRPFALLPRSIGGLINGFTGAVTREIRKNVGDPLYEVWQGNYHDRIIRSEQEFNTVLEYIHDNPARWEEDRFYSE